MAELGAVRIIAARAGSAADLAVLVAANDQDDGELARTGRLRPAADADAVARAPFAANLEAVGPSLALSPAAIAAAAMVTVTDAPPAVAISARVPIRAPYFGLLFGRPVLDLAITAVGGAR